MPAVTYVGNVRPATQERVRARYADVSRELSDLGFRELCFYTEQLRTYSLLLYFPMVVLMKMNGEVLSLHARLRIGASYLLFRHSSPSTIALPMGLGVKLYTGFDDGTLLVTPTFRSAAIPHSRQPIQRPRKLTLNEAWQLHRQRVEYTMKLGKVAKAADSFDGFVELSKREEALMAR